MIWRPKAMTGGESGPILGKLTTYLEVPSAMNKFSLPLSFCMLLSACTNMPTPPSQINSSYTSSIPYENLTCTQLATETNSLARRENQLTIAQEQRYKTSEMQAFWWGYGQGDGIEASELANVKGEKEAVRAQMDKNGCRVTAG